MKVSYFVCFVSKLHVAKIKQLASRSSTWKNWACLFLLAATEISLNQVALAAETLGAACPAQNFREFISAYADSEAVQRTFIKTPLKKRRLDLDAEPEPKPVVKYLKYSQLKFPLLPLQAERHAKSLSLRIEKSSGKEAEATLFKQDTDYQVTYFFVKNDCWVLVAIEDWSM